MDSPAFELSDISHRYGRNWALAHISFSLPRGRALLLTGHNGSGKTTLLRLLATSFAPSLGAMKLLGRDPAIEREALRREVALLTHSNFLYEDLSAFENLLMMARALQLEAPEANVGTVLETVGLTRREKDPVRTYSAGMRRRAALARLLLKRPKLALLDEPFGELDPQGIRDMEELLRSLKGAGVTVVLATHLIEQGEALTDTRLHLEQGRRIEATP